MSHDDYRLADTCASYGENADFWVKIIRERLDPYRVELTDQAVIDAVAATPGKVILDAGCGEGYLSRAFARAGAQATGVDACPELIDAAIDAAEQDQLAIKYLTADVAQLPLPDSTVDVVVGNHLANDLPDLNPAFAEFARVLRPGGRLVMLSQHPCFHGKTRATLADYFKVWPKRAPFDVAGITSPAEVTSWRRPLEDYTSALARNGFLIAGMTEPHPSAEQIAANPWWVDNFQRPMFLLVQAIIVKSD